jgi:hypothetical protein
MPDTTLLDIPEEEQDQMLAALRRARYGYLLALHVLLLGFENYLCKISVRWHWPPKSYRPFCPLLMAAL